MLTALNKGEKGTITIKLEIKRQKDKDRLEKALEKKYKRHERNSIVDWAIISGSGYIKHHPEILPVRNFWFGDVREINGNDILKVLGLQPGDVDLVVGGPPCQGFSTAGKREVMDPRNSLVFDFARLVIEIQPKTMCMENVPGILSMITPEGIPVIDAFCKILEEGDFAGYDAIKKMMASTSGVELAMKKGGTKRTEQHERKEVQACLF